VTVLLTVLLSCSGF